MVKAEPIGLLNYSTVAGRPSLTTTCRPLCCSLHVCMLPYVHIQGSKLSASMRQLFSLVCKI